MKPARALFAFTLSLCLAGTSYAQVMLPFLGNDLQPSAGGTNVRVFNSPSIGSTLPYGPFGDLSYTGIPASRMATASGVAELVSIEHLFLGDVDWPHGAPKFHDISFINRRWQGPDTHISPDFGLTALMGLLSLGNSGAPHPCTVMPMTSCTNSTQCPPAVTGYLFDIDLSAMSQELAANDFNGASTQLVTLLPGGMFLSTTGLVGACGLGDYVFMGTHSEQEYQADYLSPAGASWCDGVHFGSQQGVPLPDPLTNMSTLTFGLRENVIEPEVTDTNPADPYGPVRGGASLGADTSFGGLSVAAHVTCSPDLVGKPVFPVVSLGALGGFNFPPSASVWGADLLVVPDELFSSTLALWAGTGALAGVDQNGDGVFDQAEAVSTSLVIPAGYTGRVYFQAFIVTGFQTAESTTRWAMDLR